MRLPVVERYRTSLPVGDAVEIDAARYSCDSCGSWEGVVMGWYGWRGARAIRTRNTYRAEAVRQRAITRKRNRQFYVTAEKHRSGMALISTILLLGLIIGIATHVYVIASVSFGIWLLVYYGIVARNKSVK